MQPIYECFCPHRNHGFDRKGRPIYVEQARLLLLSKGQDYE